MCKSKKRTDAIEPNSNSTKSRSRSSTIGSSPQSSTTPMNSVYDSSNSLNPNFIRSWNVRFESSSSISPSTASATQTTSFSSKASLSSLHQTLPEKPTVFSFSEICSATNNFLAGKISTAKSSSPAWKCSLRNREVVIFQRKLRKQMDSVELYRKLSFICNVHHSSLIKLVGASVSGDFIYLVYNYVHGSNLSICLRNPRNPNFTILSNWMSRMQIATDIAHGLDYIHNNCSHSSDFSLIHNRIKSSSIIITEPDLQTKICHFGTSYLTEDGTDQDSFSRPERTFEGTRGYMSPEFKHSGVGTQESDVYSYGVVLLELLSGEEPLKYVFETESGVFRRVSLIENAREVLGGGGDEGGGEEGRLRRWIDRRLRDSYPVEVAKEMTRVALECVEEDPEKRPGMGRVAGKISKMYLKSQSWGKMIGVPVDLTVSFVPR